MSYFIIPPIIIVVGLSLLVYLLMRKSEEASLEGAFSEKQEVRSEKRLISVATSAIGQFFLKVLERMMHRSKLMSLRFHNLSDELFHSIREKRQERMKRQTQQSTESFSEETKPESGSREQDRMTDEEKITAIPSQARNYRPLVKEGVTVSSGRKSPQARTKEQLEEVLIRRIAVNPKDIEAYERLGNYYMESGSYQDSLECFKQVLLLSPSHHKARSRIRRLEKLIG